MVVRMLGSLGFSPKVWGEVSVGLLQSVEGCLQEVALRTGVTRTLTVAIFQTSELQQFLRRSGCNQTSTTRGRNETHSHATAFSRELAANCVRLFQLASPVSSSHRDERHFGGNDSSLDSVSNFGSGFPAKTNVSVHISDGNECLESGSLTGSGLLLDRHDFHDFILQLTIFTSSSSQKVLDDFVFLDTKGESVDITQLFDGSAVHQSAQTGDWFPFLFEASAASASTSSPASSSASSSATSTTTTASSSSSLLSITLHFGVL